ncbi:hypothetical protein NAF17_10115 [Mucilaginibacter sp. RB4R14]|uniref:hypothetical protein n=1 Tax=Mucilaginibacter aurantiaciroseus TaxID=2949308 RepID=UPI0020908E3E|nr:hypothetical protein [Mucilaginibacter aurantiaciroseus]MCO5935898.1 hypothetical protein [Mucilaginibacter aurantiaciroseus]
MKPIPLMFCALLIVLSACEKKIDHQVYLLTNADSSALNLTGNPEVRKEVIAYMHAIAPDKPGAARLTSQCTDDLVAVGPEGLRSISGGVWKKNAEKDGIIFKKVLVVPGTEIVRLYNDGNTAVRNVLLDVTLGTPAGEMNLDVMRLETYIKKGAHWCMVAGQGTVPYDRMDVMKTLVIRIVLAFVAGLLIMFLVMRRKLNKLKLK